MNNQICAMGNRKFVFIVAIILFVPTKFASAPITSSDPYGADFTKPGHNVPYHLSLQFQGFKHFCSAVLSTYPNRYLWKLDSSGMPTMPSTIKERQIGITSAACVNHSIWPILAVAGQTDYKDRSGAQIRVVNVTHIHPKFNRKTMEHNIAILLFEWEFKTIFTPTPGKNRVWPINYDIPWHISGHHILANPIHNTNTPFYITGYGFMYPGITEATKNKLQVVKSKVGDLETTRPGGPRSCSAKYDYDPVNQKTYYKPSFSRCYQNTKTMDASKRCYGDDGAVVVSCNIYDDSCYPGGPTTVTDHSVIGIVNHGHDCFHKIDLAFFTLVSCYTMSNVDANGVFEAGWFETVLNEGKELDSGVPRLPSKNC